MQEIKPNNAGHSAYSRQKRLREIGVIVLGFVLIPVLQGMWPQSVPAEVRNVASLPSILGFLWQLVLLVFLIGNGMPRIFRNPLYWKIDAPILLKGLGLGLFLLAIASIPALFLPKNSAAAIPFSFPTSTFAWISVFVTLGLAVVVEELLYRVYFLERLATLGVRPVLAILVTVPLFAAGHAYQGLGGIVIALVGGTVLAISWLRWKSFWANAMGHFAYNIIVLLATFYRQ